MSKGIRSNITKFGLLRHGQTEWNREKRIQGQSDSSLSRKGEEQARRWGRRLKGSGWTRIIASDLGRAVRTAEIINGFLQIPMATDSRLREQDWGGWVGKTLPQLHGRFAEELAVQQQAGWKFRPPGGEDRLQVRDRCMSFLHKAAAGHAGEEVLLVCHEGVIKCLLYHLSGRKFLPEEPALIRPYHLHLLHHDGRMLRIEQVNAVDLET